MLLFVFLVQSLRAGVARVGNSSQVALQQRTTNRVANVNSTINVNQSVNVNRNLNMNNNVYVHGGYYGCCCCYTGSSWNWESFAAGAAVGGVGTAAAASRGEGGAAPATRTVVPTLPGRCSSVSSGGTVIYHCGSVCYRPFYQGATLVYQVVTYP
jgi:hypothetical protein